MEAFTEVKGLMSDRRTPPEKEEREGGTRFISIKEDLTLSSLWLSENHPLQRRKKKIGGGKKGEGTDPAFTASSREKKRGGRPTGVVQADRLPIKGEKGRENLGEGIGLETDVLKERGGGGGYALANEGGGKKRSASLQ